MEEMLKEKDLGLKLYIVSVMFGDFINFTNAVNVIFGKLFIFKVSNRFSLNIVNFNSFVKRYRISEETRRKTT